MLQRNYMAETLTPQDVINQQNDDHDADMPTLEQLAPPVQRRWFDKLFGRGERPVTLAEKLKANRARAVDQDLPDEPSDTGANLQESSNTDTNNTPNVTAEAEPEVTTTTPEPALTEVFTPDDENDSTVVPDFLKEFTTEPQPVKNVQPLNVAGPARATETARTPAFYPEDIAQMNIGIRAAEVKKQEAKVNLVARERSMAERIKNAEAKRATGKIMFESTMSRIVDKTGDLVGAAFSIPDRAVAVAQRETGRVFDAVKRLDISVADYRNRLADELEAGLALASGNIENLSLNTEAIIVRKLADGARTTANVLNVAASVRLELARKQLVAQSKEYTELTGAWEQGTVSEEILDEQIIKMDATRKKIAELVKAGMASTTESVATSLVVESAKTRSEAKKRKENGGKWLSGLRKWLVGAVDAKPNLA